MNKKIMFDSNAFDKFIGSNLWNKVVLSDEYDFYITSIQIEELAAIPDEKKEQRIRNFLVLCSMKVKLLYVPAILGYSRYGFSVLTDKNDVYFKLLNETHSNIKDAMIGSSAKHECCCVVTDDKRFIKKLNDNLIMNMRFDDFINSFTGVNNKC